MNNAANRSQPARSAAATPWAGLVVSLAACLLLALGGLGLAQGASPAQDPVTVRLAPAAASGSVGDVFTIQVYVDNVPDFVPDPSFPPGYGSGGVQSWQVSIAFDPAVVELNPGQSAPTYFAGNLYTTGGYSAFPIVNVAANKITLAQALLGTPPSYPSGSNLLLATIKWRAVGAGTSALDTNTSKIVKDGFNSIVYSPLAELDGQITVAGGAPTPTATPPSAPRIYLPLLLRARS